MHSHHSNCPHNALCTLSCDSCTLTAALRHPSYIGQQLIAYLVAFGGRVGSVFDYQSSVPGSIPLGAERCNFTFATRKREIECEATKLRAKIIDFLLFSV